MALAPARPLAATRSTTVMSLKKGSRFVAQYTGAVGTWQERVALWPIALPGALENRWMCYGPGGSFTDEKGSDWQRIKVVSAIAYPKDCPVVRFGSHSYHANRVYCDVALQHS